MLQHEVYAYYSVELYNVYRKIALLLLIVTFRLKIKIYSNKKCSKLLFLPLSSNLVFSKIFSFYSNVIKVIIQQFLKSQNLLI